MNIIGQPANFHFTVEEDWSSGTIGVGYLTGLHITLAPGVVFGKLKEVRLHTGQDGRWYMNIEAESQEVERDE